MGTTMIKFKQTKEKTFTIKGLGLQHLQAIMTLVNSTVCGEGIYEQAVYDLGSSFDKFVCPNLSMDDCVLTDDYGSDMPTLYLSHIED